MRRSDYGIKRQAIVQNSVALFFERGFDNVNLRMMLEQAAVSKGTFYHYFSSKDELVEACYSDVFTHFAEGLNQLLQDKRIQVAEKLSYLLRWPASYTSIISSEDSISLTEFLLADGNQELKRLFEARYQEAINEPLAILLEQANANREAEVSRPRETATLVAIIMLPLIYLVNGTLRIHDETNDVDHTLHAGLECIERTLKLPYGSLTRFSKFENYASSTQQTT